MNFLAVGGSGFLGSSVADALNGAGHCVTVFNTHESLYLMSDQNILTGDLMDLNQLEACLKGLHFAYHFSGVADINGCKVRQLDTSWGRFSSWRHASRPKCDVS